MTCGRNLHADNENILVLPLYGAGVESGVAAYALHEIGVGSGVKIIFPVWRHHFGGDYGIGVALVDTVALQDGRWDE